MAAVSGDKTPPVAPEARGYTTAAFPLGVTGKSSRGPGTTSMCQPQWACSAPGDGGGSGQASLLIGLHPTSPKQSNLASGLHPNGEPATPPCETVLDSRIFFPWPGSGPMQVYLWNCVIASRSRLDAMPSLAAGHLAVRPGGTLHGIGPGLGGNDFPPRACSSGQDGTFISSRRPVVFTGRSHGPKWCRKGSRGRGRSVLRQLAFTSPPSGRQRPA